MTKDYTVYLTVGYQGTSLETKEVVDAYSESEAKSDAEDRVRDNILFTTNRAELDEDTGEWEIEVSVEHGGYTFEATERTEANSEGEARSDAIERVRDNCTVIAYDAQCEVEDDYGEY